MNEHFWTGFAVGAVVSVSLVALLGVGFCIIRPWIRLKMSGGRGSLLSIVGMRLRGTPPLMIVDAYTSLLHSGEKVRLAEVESQYVANRAQIMDTRDLLNLVRELKRSQQLAQEKTVT